MSWAFSVRAAISAPVAPETAWTVDIWASKAAKVSTQSRRASAISLTAPATPAEASTAASWLTASWDTSPNSSDSSPACLTSFPYSLIEPAQPSALREASSR